MQNCFFKKNRELSSSNTSHDHTESSSTTKRRHDIAEILAYAFIAKAQKNDYQIIALWPKDFEELEA